MPITEKIKALNNSDLSLLSNKIKKLNIEQHPVVSGAAEQNVESTVYELTPARFIEQLKISKRSAS